MNTFKEKYQAIIFDMDGTILFSDKAYWSAIKNTLAEHGIGPEQEDKWAELQKNLTGLGMVSMADNLKKLCSLNVCPIELRNKIELGVHTELPLQTTMFEGFDLFHEELKKNNLKSAIATNSNSKAFEILINKFGFSQMFGEHLYCVDHVSGKAKPDPSIFLYAAKQLNVNPKNCVVFEDSYVGFLAAKAAGMKCIGIKNSKNQNFLGMVDEQIDHYSQAIDALKNLTKK